MDTRAYIRNLLLNKQYSDDEDDDVDMKLDPILMAGDDSDCEELGPEETYTINLDHGIQVLEYDGEPSQKIEDLVNSDPVSEEVLGEKLLLEPSSSLEIAKLLGDDVDNYSESEDESEEDDHAEKFDSELLAYQKKSVKSTFGRRRNKALPQALAGLFGEANLLSMRDKHDDAIKICTQIIKEAPYAPQAYHTLARALEKKGQHLQSMHCYRLHAFLDQTVETWENCAEMFRDTDIREAEYCLGRAIRADPTKLENHREYLTICETIGENFKTLRGYQRYVKHLGPNNGKEAMTIACEIARIHYSEKSYPAALKALQKAFHNHPTFVTPNELNLCLEVVMVLPNYALCVQTLIDYADLTLNSPETMEREVFDALPIEERVKISTCTVVDPDLPLELKAKLAISVINLKSPHLATNLVTEICKSSRESYGDLWLEVAEAFHKNEGSAQALPILEQLVGCVKFQVAAVLLLMAECYMNCERFTESAKSFDQVIELAPHHTGAKLSYSCLLRKMGRNEEAKRVLDTTDRILDCVLLHQQCQLHLAEQQHDQFIMQAKLLLLKHFVNVRSVKEVDIFLRIRKYSSRMDYLHAVRKSLNEPLEETEYAYIGADVTLEDHWNIYIQFCDILCQQKRFCELERFAIGALGSRIFMKNATICRHTEFISIMASVYSERFENAFNMLRVWMPKYPDCNRLWNLLGYIIARSDDPRYNRYLLGLTVRFPESLSLAVLRGHSCLVAGSYKFALVEYIQGFKERPGNPFLALMTGLTYVHMACQKFSAKKHKLVIQAAAFLSAYRTIVGESAETHFNMGRAYHQLSLFPVAIFFYKKVIEYYDTTEQLDEDALHITFQAAYNLHLIYKKNNKKLANYYLHKYCVC